MHSNHDIELANALLKCSQVRKYRQDIVNLLMKSNDIHIPCRNTEAAHIMQIVTNTIDFPEKLADLVEIVEYYEGKSIHLDGVYAVCKQHLWIKYYIDQEMLFGAFSSDGEDNIEKYDIEQCETQFISMCRQKLTDIYPAYTIDIQLADPSYIRVNDCTDTSRVENVQSICKDIHTNYEWVVYQSC